MMTTLSIVMDLKTKQVDYTNAFAQAELCPDEHIFVELPRDFETKMQGDYVLTLLKSLYGLNDAPLRWFEKLFCQLKKHGFCQSLVDPCLFLHPKMVCICWVDDCLFYARDSKDIDDMLTDLRSEFTLEEEAEVNQFLGIEYSKSPEGDLELVQTGLIDKVINYCGMLGCNSKATPANQVPLGTCANGPKRVDGWNYASAVGMLLYLAQNTCPDIAFAVHQCARFTHCPCKAHEDAIKRICRYLQGTRT